MKESPLCPTPNKKPREVTLSDDILDEEEDDGDDGVVPQKMLDEANEKVRHYRKQLKETKQK